MTDVDDKVALITGVTSGYGRACAKVFAEQGAHVVGIARRAELGTAFEAELRDRGADITFVPGDVTVPADCRRAVETAVLTYGRLEILVNNAGSAGAHPVDPSHEVREEDWDVVVDTNLKGSFFCSRYAIAHMRSNGGGVIWNIASINAVEPVARMAAYNSSKAALLQLTRSLAIEYGEEGIRVNALILGGGATEMARFVADEMGRAIKGPDYVPETRPSRMDLEEFARLLALLCSDRARLVTGALVPVDRGISAGLLTSRMIWGRAAGLLDL